MTLFCDNCGEPIGEGKRERGDFVSCGQAECNRAEQDAYRQEREEAQDAAARDDFDRYR